MTVYIAQRNDGALKIGFTTQLRKRVQQLKTAAHMGVRVLAAADGSIQHERYLHHVYRRHRVLGDWFSNTDEITSYAANAAKYGYLGFDVFAEPKGYAVDFDKYLAAVGITRKHFADFIGISHKQLPSYETSGELSPRLGTFQFIADELRERIDWHACLVPDVYGRAK